MEAEPSDAERWLLRVIPDAEMESGKGEKLSMENVGFLVEYSCDCENRPVLRGEVLRDIFAEFCISTSTEEEVVGLKDMGRESEAVCRWSGSVWTSLRVEVPSVEAD